MVTPTKCGQPLAVGQAIMSGSTVQGSLTIAAARQDGSAATAATKLRPCELVKLSIAGLDAHPPHMQSGWVFDISSAVGGFLGTSDGDARRVGCSRAGAGAGRWQSFKSDYSGSIDEPATLRMPESADGGPVMLVAAYATSLASQQSQVSLTAQMSLSVDAADTDKSLCAAAVPAGGDAAAAAAPPLPAGLRAHGCLQCLAWLVCLLPGAIVARHRSLLGLRLPTAAGGVEQWYAIHRVSQSLGVVATLAGVGCAVGSIGVSLDHWHSCVGCAVPCLAVVQGILGWGCRPPKEDVARRARWLKMHRALSGTMTPLALFCVGSGIYMALDRAGTIGSALLMVAAGLLAAAGVATAYCEWRACSAKPAGALGQSLALSAGPGGEPQDEGAGAGEARGGRGGPLAAVALLLAAAAAAAAALLAGDS